MNPEALIAHFNAQVAVATDRMDRLAAVSRDALIAARDVGQAVTDLIALTQGTDLAVPKNGLLNWYARHFPGRSTRVIQNCIRIHRNWSEIEAARALDLIDTVTEALAYLRPAKGAGDNPQSAGKALDAIVGPHTPSQAPTQATPSQGTAGPDAGPETGTQGRPLVDDTDDDSDPSVSEAAKVIQAADVADLERRLVFLLTGDGHDPADLPVDQRKAVRRQLHSLRRAVDAALEMIEALDG